MLDCPKTVEDARKYRYGAWAGRPNGMPYKEGSCAYKVQSRWIFIQCSRKNGYGPGGLYCKQHAKKVEKE